MALLGVDIFADPLEILAPAFIAVNVSKAARVSESTARSVITDIARAADRTSDIARTADNIGDVAVALNAVDVTADVSRGVNAVEDVTAAARPITEESIRYFRQRVLRAQQIGEPFSFTDDLISSPRMSIGYKPQKLMPRHTASNAPAGMRWQIGFGNEGKLIPDPAGNTDLKVGFLDLTKNLE